MHGGVFVLDGQRMEICGRPPEGFANPIVLDPLTQYWDGGLYRLWPNERYHSRGGKRLHLAVWTAVYGAVPRGCHIHHRNDDSADNRIENLECLPMADHLSLTWHRGVQRGRVHTFTPTAHARAAEWHKSEAGRLWHSRHAKRQKSWTKWKREDRPCLECGSIFACLIRANGHQQKFCSGSCKATHYRKRKAVHGGTVA
jgi:hypothetical protein